MDKIVKMNFGSHVYGTNTPTSDIDIKGIFVPEFRDTILGKEKESINNNTKTDQHAKNTAEDIDEEYFSLKHYFKMLSRGDTVTVDMLFVPHHHLYEFTPMWTEIQNNKHHLIHSGFASFVGYCKKQANKYGIKGSRVAAARAFLSVLQNSEDMAKINDIKPLLEILINEHPDHCAWVTCRGPGNVPAEHFECVNKKMPMGLLVKHARIRFEEIVANYGQRSLLAEQNDGVDWKALMHAVRIAHEAVELLSTGHITFPRPEADLLLKIRKGEMDYKAVAVIIEQGLIDVEEAGLASKLPKNVNQDWIDDFIVNSFFNKIATEHTIYR